MGKVYDEGHLRFTFSAACAVEKYDDHRDYREKIGKLAGSKAIDFVVLRAANLFLIEVKDFRGYRIANKHRLSDGELALEVAEKVRDTVAGIVGAHRMSAEPATWRPYGKALHQREKFDVRVIVWLEQDALPTPRGVGRQHALVLQDQMKKELRWMTTKVIVMSQHDQAVLGHWLHVANLPGAGQAN